MTSPKRELKPGMKIRFNGPCNFANHEVCWGSRTKAKVDSVDSAHDRVFIKFTDGDGGIISFSQVVSVLRPKAPKEEQGRVERWFDPKHYISSEVQCKGMVRCVEVREGERVLSREELEKAFDKAKAKGFFEHNDSAAESSDFCCFLRALGFLEGDKA